MILLEKIIMLRSVNIFQEVSDELIAEIASKTTEFRVNKGDYIIKKGEVDDVLYIIVEGKVIIKEDENILAELGSQQIFGELAVLSPEPRTASVVAVEDCLLLKLHRQDLVEHLSININLAMGIIQQLCNLIRLMTKQIHELTSHQHQISKLGH
ncbi:MAG: cyclic nucleotide-binding domain-containing protein [Gammaproteobacteria bacterium]|nr:cyclic nucleotide-binding domain-containing protein [Gammaproteobacteria bacterium]